MQWLPPCVARFTGRSRSARSSLERDESGKTRRSADLLARAFEIRHSATHGRLVEMSRANAFERRQGLEPDRLGCLPVVGCGHLRVRSPRGKSGSATAVDCYATKAKVPALAAFPSKKSHARLLRETRSRQSLIRGTVGIRDDARYPMALAIVWGQGANRSVCGSDAVCSGHSGQRCC